MKCKCRGIEEGTNSYNWGRQKKPREKNSRVDNSTIGFKSKAGTCQKISVSSGHSSAQWSTHETRRPHIGTLGKDYTPNPPAVGSWYNRTTSGTGSGVALTLAPTWSPPCSLPPERVAVSSQVPWTLLRPSMSRGLTFRCFSSRNMCFALLCRVKVLPSVETFINILIA